MKILIIIKVCQRDDFIAWHSYNSFKEKYPKAHFIFFAEDHVSYHWIHKPMEMIIYRPYRSNLGGWDYARPFIEDLKVINTEGFDKVILSDADIVLKKDVLYFNYDMGGIQHQSEEKERHFSGQLMIFNKWLFDLVVNYSDYQGIKDDIIRRNWGVADDTMMSLVALKYTNNTFNFFELDYWDHEKRFHLEKDYEW